MPPTHHDGPGRETDVPRTTTLQVDDGLARTRQLTVAVTGVTGYVGGRLVPELLAAGHRVRALARNPCRLRGVDVAYYLIHSLGTGQRSEATDRATALTFARAAREAGVKRIIHLGGLHPESRTAPRTWPLAWRVRGLIDRLTGGPGLRRGRRDPRQLWVDDAVDFWRVEDVVPERLLRLRAEAERIAAGGG